MGSRPALTEFQRTLLGGLAVTPAVVLTIYFLIGDIMLLADKCHAFAGETLARGGDCTGFSESTQSRAGFLLMMLAVKGPALLGIGLSVFGLARGRSVVAYAGAGALAVAGFSLLLGGTGILMFLSAGMVVAATILVRSR